MSESMVTPEMAKLMQQMEKRIIDKVLPNVRTINVTVTPSNGDATEASFVLNIDETRRLIHEEIAVILQEMAS